MDAGEAANPPREEAPASRMHSLRADGLAAVIATLVGMLALLVAGYTAWIQRQQVRAQVWPSLLWVTMDAESRYVWMNKGVGPALVNSVEVRVDGKPQPGWREVFQALGLERPAYGTSTLVDNVIAAGETLPWLVFYDNNDLTTFRRAAEGRLAFRVCYCSTLGDCWINDSSAGSGNPRIPASSCPTLPEATRFQD